MRSGRRNVHDHFASGNTFIVAGIAVVSLMLCAQTALFTPPSFVQREEWAVAMLGLTAIVSILAVTRLGKRGGYSFYTDGLPYLLFPSALLVAGSESKGILILLGISVMANIAFLLANRRHDTISEEEDLIRLYFRWPF